MKRGTLKWFNRTKGFGFIVPDDGGPDVFIHHEVMKAAGVLQIRENTPVLYEVSDETSRACSVRLPNVDHALVSNLSRRGRQLINAAAHANCKDDQSELAADGRLMIAAATTIAAIQQGAS